MNASAASSRQDMYASGSSLNDDPFANETYYPPRYAPPVRRRRDATTRPTIPSEYVTTLNSGAGISRGFGSSESRWNGARADETPGPGAYKTGERRGAMGYAPPRAKGPGFDTGSESWGSKGMGGLASKGSRFSSTSSDGPGPAAYGVITTTADGSRMGRLSGPWGPAGPGASAAFRQHDSRARAKKGEVGEPVAETLGPGPQSYDSGPARDHTSLVTENKLGGASMASKTARWSDRKVEKAPQQTPASAFPGSFGNGSSVMTAPGFGSFGRQKRMENRAKGSRLNSRGGAAHLPSQPIPTFYTAAEEIVRAREVGDPERAAEARITPGPGTYDSNVVIKARHTLPTRTIGQALRFGTLGLGSAADPTPGPADYGRYKAQGDIQNRPTGGASMRNGESRFSGQGGPDQEIPGPAYYNPDKPDKKSYHLNLAQRWV